MILVLAERPNERLLQWLDRYRANVAVVRPDRYVMGTGKSLDAITSEIQSVLETGAHSDSVSQASGVRREIVS